MEFAPGITYAINGLLAGLLVLWLFGTAAAAKKTRNPSKLQVLMEMLVDGMASQFRGILGPGGEKHLPLPLALFFYILFCNVLGLIPGLTSATAATGTTMSLALIVFVYVQYVGLTSNGILGYLKHYLGPSIVEVKPGLPPAKAILSSVMVAVVGLLFLPIEMITELFAKPFSLGMRLFGNIYAEDVINGMAVKAGNALHIPAQFPVYFLQLFTDLIQAFVFALLACVYISLVAHHDEGGGEHAHAPAEHASAPA